MKVVGWCSDLRLKMIWTKSSLQVCISSFKDPFYWRLYHLSLTLEIRSLAKFSFGLSSENLPLELWNPQALGKILSKVGLPIRTDQVIASKGSISFARALVEVDASMDLIEEVRFRLPTGKTFIQQIEYENRPTFCTHCKMIGHRIANYKAMPTAKIDFTTTRTPLVSDTSCWPSSSQWVQHPQSL